jgi:hypothetical protein
LSLFQENEILTEQEELLAMEQFLRRQIASEKEEIDRLRAEIAEIQRYRGLGLEASSRVVLYMSRAELKVQWFSSSLCMEPLAAPPVVVTPAITLFPCYFITVTLLPL